MLKNYLKVALRNLLKDKLNSYINVFGLSVAIAASTVIFLYVHNELTYEAFHENAESIFLVYKERHLPTGIQITRDTWVPLASALTNEYPSIKAVTRVWNNTSWVQYASKKFQENVTYVDPTFLEMFTFPLVRGDKKAVFTNLNSVVISSAIANKYFGEEDPIGKTINLDYQTDYIVHGVLAEIPQNSLLQIDFLITFESAPDYDEFKDNWGASFLSTYLLLADASSAPALEAQFPAFVSNTWSDQASETMKLKLLNRLDLYNELTGANTYAFILLAVAVIIVIIASINFVNLSTARSLERAREIGMRKVLGAARFQIMRQFITEALIMSLFALIQGICLVEIFLPRFNHLYSMSLKMDYVNPVATFLLIGCAVLIGFIAGAYPAFVLSRYLPSQSLKGRLKTSRAGSQLRHSLVVVQFGLAVILIIGSAVMWKQVKFMRSASLNFEKENVIAITVRQSDFEDREQGRMQMDVFKNALQQHNRIQRVSSSQHVPGSGYGSFIFVYPSDRDDSKRLRMRRTVVDAEFFETYGIRFLEGRSFRAELGTEANESIILNEAALKAIGWASGEEGQIRIGSTAYKVIGVVQDYHFRSLASGLAPLVHVYRPADNAAHRYISVRTTSGDFTPVLNYIQQQWQKLDPTRTFDFFFVDENFNLQYQNENRLATVTSSFTMLAVIIACLGLFALASLIVAQRTKEIGVRKAIGASVQGILFLISASFAKLVGLAFLFSAPLAFMVCKWWLADFAIKTEIGWEVFALAGVLCLGIAILAVSYQSIKSALLNPVEALRYE